MSINTLYEYSPTLLQAFAVYGTAHIMKIVKDDYQNDYGRALLDVSTKVQKVWESFPEEWMINLIAKFHQNP